MKLFNYNTYMTEEKLGNMLDSLFAERNIEVKRQVQFGKYKADFLVGEALVVDFHGARHYTTEETMERDRELIKLARDEQGFKFMIVPYFLQADYVCEALGFKDTCFGYHHGNGFIHPKMIRPQDFSLMGLISFAISLNTFTPKVKKEIISTMNPTDMFCYEHVCKTMNID